MATVKDTEVARLTEELAVVELTIKTVQQNGQSFRKGGSTGFAADQAKLSELRKERSEIRAKLAVWGVYDA